MEYNNNFITGILLNFSSIILTRNCNKSKINNSLGHFYKDRLETYKDTLILLQYHY